jgi:asparagine synthase (glutamine-hydrolysing)
VSFLLNHSFTAKYRKERFEVTGDNIKKRLIEDIFHSSLQSLLRYEDRNTMRFSIEGRVPFLDFDLVRYLFSLPDTAIINGGWNKHILRKAVKDLLPEIITNRRNKIGFTTPEHEWFIRMKNRIYGIFLSESFTNRPYFNQAEVVKAFEAFIQGKNDDTMLFWRLLNVELWLREFFDPPLRKGSDGTAEKGSFDPNEGKKIMIEVDGKNYSRYSIRTDLVNKDTNIKSFIASYVKLFLTKAEKEQKYDGKKKWFVIISEKIVAISQGRSYFIWDIKPSWWASTLSKFVKRTPYGIGLGSPFTMQIAIQEIGLPRILLASVASVVTKPFGMKGIFYQIVGPEIAAIDGPTEYSVYPSNVSAKLAPKNPLKVAIETVEEVYNAVPKHFKGTFGGVIIIDANDLGRNVLGNATDLPDTFFEKVMKDNPMGQGSEQTPLVLLIS